MKFNFPNSIIALTASVLLTACGGSSDSGNSEETTSYYDSSYSVADGKLNASLSSTYSSDAGFDDDVRRYFQVQGASEALDSSTNPSISADINFYGSLTKGNDSSARLEADAGLYFSDSDGNTKSAIIRIRYDGTEFTGHGFVESCPADGECFGDGIFIDLSSSESSGLSDPMDLGETLNISVTYFDEDTFKFTFGDSSEVTLDLQDITVDINNLNYAAIRGSIRNLKNEGESGSLDLKFDNVELHGDSYDNFNDSTSLDTDKWQSDTFGF